MGENRLAVIDRLLRAAMDAASDLEAEINARYGELSEYPSEKRRMDNDMETVTKLRAAIAEYRIGHG